MISDSAGAPRSAPVVVARIQPRRVALGILMVNVAWVILYLVASVIHLGSTDRSETSLRLFRLFNMNAEISLPTWWAQTLLVAAAALFLWIAVLSHRSNAAWRGWAGLAFVFVIASIDEGASLHELWIRPMQDLFGVWSGPWAAGWIFPVGAALLAAAVLYLRFFLRLPFTTRMAFVAAFGMFVVGAIGFEILEWALTGTWRPQNREWIYTGFVATEEFLEMTGVGILIVGLLVHLRDHVPQHRAAVTEIAKPARSPRPAGVFTPDGVTPGATTPAEPPSRESEAAPR